MKDDDVAAKIVFSVAWVAALVGTVTYVLTGTCIDRSWRNQIVEHGCAEYYLDQNHDRQWRWK